MVQLKKCYVQLETKLCNQQIVKTLEEIQQINSQ